MEKENDKARKIEAFKHSALDGDRPLWRAMGTLADLIFISLMWLVCSLPVVTVGAASTAAYDTVAHCVRRREPGLLHRFFSTFKDVFFRAALCTVIWAAALAAWGLLLVWTAGQGEGTMGFLFLVNAMVLGAAVLGSLVWVFPILSRFEMSAGRAAAAAVRMAFANLPASLLMALTLAAAGLACYIWLFPLMVLPGLLWLFHSVFIERVFARYS